MDEELVLPAMLSWHSRFFKKIAILDGGSTDKTLEIAQKYTSNVRQRPFSGSFADERNELVKQCDTDWICTLDSDEFLDFCMVSRLADQIDERGILLPAPSKTAIQTPRLTFGFPDSWPDWQCRIYNKNYWRWYRPVHEFLVHKIDSSVALELNNPHSLHMGTPMYQIMRCQTPFDRPRMRKIEEGLEEELGIGGFKPELRQKTSPEEGKVGTE